MDFGLRFRKTVDKVLARLPSFSFLSFGAYPEWVIRQILIPSKTFDPPAAIDVAVSHYEISSSFQELVKGAKKTILQETKAESHFSSDLWAYALWDRPLDVLDSPPLGVLGDWQKREISMFFFRGTRFFIVPESKLIFFKGIFEEECK